MEAPDLAELARVNAGMITYQTCLYSILVWDWLSTLPAEYKLIWKPLFQSKPDQLQETQITKICRWMSLVCFVLVRYLCLAAFAVMTWTVRAKFTYEECARLQHFLPYSASIVALAANIILCLRVVAIWGRDRRVSLTLTALMIATIGIVLWACSYTVPTPDIDGCIPAPTSTYLNAMYLAPMIMDLIVLILTLWAAVRHNKSGTLGPLLQTLVRDGVLYFVAIFFCNLLAVVFELQNANPLLKPVNATLAPIATSIFCCKIYFGLKRAAIPSERARSTLPTNLSPPTPSFSSSSGSPRLSDAQKWDRSNFKTIQLDTQPSLTPSTTHAHSLTLPHAPRPAAPFQRSTPPSRDGAPTLSPVTGAGSILLTEQVEVVTSPAFAEPRPSGFVRPPPPAHPYSSDSIA